MQTSAADGWEGELERRLAPFLAALGREAQRRWASVYLKGLLLPGERKSVAPLAARVAPGSAEQLHHLIGGSPWPTEPLEAVLAKEADRLVGGPEAALVVDDTACPSRAGTRSGSPGSTAAASASAPTAKSWSRSPWPRARCRCRSGCGCSCRRHGRPTRSAAPGPGYPRRTAAAP